MALTRAEVLTPAKVSLATEFVVPRFNKPMNSEMITNKSASRDWCDVVTLVNLSPYATDSQHFVGETPNDEMFKQDARGRGFLTKMPHPESKTGYAYRVIPASQFIALASEMETGWVEQERIKQENERLLKLQEQMRADADEKAKELKEKTHARFRKLAVSMFGEGCIGANIWSNIDDRVTWNSDAKSYDVNVGGTVSMTLEMFEQLTYLYSEWKQKQDS
jgi:hypothetical protein